MNWNDLRAPVCWAAALTLIVWGFLGFPALCRQALPDMAEGTLAYYVANAAQQIILLGLPSLLILAARSARWRRFRSSLKPLRAQTLAGCALLAMGCAVVLAVAASLWGALLKAWTGYAPPERALPAPTGVGEALLCLLVIAVIPAACEELFFRVLLQGALDHWLPRAGLAIAALAFAALHFRWDAFPALVLLGLALGGLYIRRGYLGSLTLHALYNAAVLALSAAGARVSLGLLAACAVTCIAALRLLFGKENPHETDRTGL